MGKRTSESGSPQQHSRAPMERMLRIHAAIREGGFPNATRLARELEVSAKTIQRDIEFMRDRLQLPLEYNESRFGYHYTEAVENFPTMQISEGELFSLLVAEKALQQYRGTPFEGRLMGAFQKIARSLPESVSMHVSEWEESISFRTTAEPLVDVPVMDVLAKAVQERRQLEVMYRKPGQAEPELRILDPYHLANVNGDWYIFGLDHMRKDLRTFVPARIRSAKFTGVTFERPPKFTLEQRLKDSFGVHSQQGEYRVVLRFDANVADYIREKRWHPSQELRELTDGDLEMRLNLGSLIEIQRWILGWGGSARVMAPDELKESVRAAARRLLTRH